jgi:hypothetical protein
MFGVFVVVLELRGGLMLSLGAGLSLAETWRSRAILAGSRFGSGGGLRDGMRLWWFMIRRFDRGRCVVRGMDNVCRELKCRKQSLETRKGE